MSITKLFIETNHGEIEIDSSPTYMNTNGLSYGEYLWKVNNSLNLEELSYLREKLVLSGKKKMWTEYAPYWTPQAMGINDKGRIFVAKITEEGAFRDTMDLEIDHEHIIPSKLTRIKRGYVQSFAHIAEDIYFPIIGPEKTALGTFNLSSISHIPLPVAIGFDGERIESSEPLYTLSAWERKIVE